MLKVSQNQLLYSSVAIASVALALGLTLQLKPHIELAVFAALCVAIAFIVWYGAIKFLLASAENQRQAEDKVRQSYERLEFLANASSRLTTSLDYKTTLASVARLAVPFLADICVVDLIETELAESSTRVAVAHVDEAKEQLLTELSRKYPYFNNQRSPLFRVVSDRIPYLISEVTESLILEFAQDDEHLRLLKELGYCSAMIVPLIIRGQILGIISFGTTSASSRFYTADDLAFAEDLARPIALAIDNARFYQKTHQAEQRNDEFLALLDACTSSAPIGLAFLDRERRYIRINDALAAIYHIKASENLGKTVWQTLDPQLASAVDAKIEQVLQSKEPILNVEETGNLETYYISNYYPVRSELGEILGVGMTVLDISERKRAEAALYQREQEFRALVENVPDIIVRFDRNLRYLYACPTTEQVTGISPAAFIGKTNKELGFPKAMCTLWNESLQKVFATGVADKLEFEIPRFDGTHYYESRLIPEFNQDKSISSVLTLVRDMTEYKRAEQERTRLLEEVESKQKLLETVLEQMPGGLIVAEAPSGRFLMKNEQMRQILSDDVLSVERIEEYDQFEYRGFHPNGQAYALEEIPLVRSLKSGEVVHSEEMNIVWDDGRYKTVLVDSSPIHNTQGEITAAVVTFYEITERKQVEEALRESEERFRELAENMQDVFWMFNPQQRQFLYVSPAYEEIWGYSRESVYANYSKWFDIIHPDDRERVRSACFKSASKKHSMKSIALSAQISQFLGYAIAVLP